MFKFGLAFWFHLKFDQYDTLIPINLIFWLDLIRYFEFDSIRFESTFRFFAQGYVKPKVRLFILRIYLFYMHINQDQNGFLQELHFCSFLELHTNLLLQFKTLIFNSIPFCVKIARNHAKTSFHPHSSETIKLGTPQTHLLFVMPNQLFQLIHRDHDWWITRRLLHCSPLAQFTAKFRAKMAMYFCCFFYPSSRYLNTSTGYNYFLKHLYYLTP